jgi:hypothetical protein
MKMPGSNSSQSAHALLAASLASLPVELLQRVFELLGAIADDSVRDKLRIAHVCSLWRRIIFDQSHLWATIRLDGFRQSLVPLQRFLNLSKSSLLNIKLDLSPLAWHQEGESTITYALYHMYRIRFLDLRIQGEKNIQHASKKFKDLEAPALEQLTVLFPQDGTSFARDHIYINKFNAPLLRTGRFSFNSWSMLRPPCLNLTTMVLEHSNHDHPMPGLPDLQIILHEMPNLVTLVVNQRMTDPFMPSVTVLHEPRISMHRLRNLYTVGTNATLLLIALNSPRLTTLELEGVCHLSLDSPQFHQAESKFPFLTSITLRNSDLSSNNWLQLFRAIPSLQILSVVGGTGLHLTSALNTCPPDVVLKLRTIKLHKLDRIDGRAILRFLGERSPAQLHLHPRFVQTDRISNVAAIQEAGSQIDIVEWMDPEEGILTGLNMDL